MIKMTILAALGFAREQKRVNARISTAVAVVCLAYGGSASAARGDEQLRSAIELCTKSNSPVERLGACSTVISRTKDRALLGRSYNRRGHANMALRRFQEAADDFSHVIKLNPEIAGYYDNRQNASRSMGMLHQALKDANTAVRLAPTYAFVFRSRALVYADLEHYELALKDLDRATSIDPGNSGLFTERGKVQAKAQRLHAAVADFSRAYDLD